MGLWIILSLLPAGAGLAASLCGTKTYLQQDEVVALDIESGNAVSAFTLELTEDVTLTGKALPPALANAFNNVPSATTQTFPLPFDRSMPLSFKAFSGKMDGVIAFGRHGSISVEHHQKSYILEHQADEKIKAVPNGSGSRLDVRFRPGADAVVARDIDGNASIVLKKGAILEIPVTHPRRIELRLKQGIYLYDSVEASHWGRLEIEEPLRTAPQSSFMAVLRKFGTVFSSERVAACVRPANPALGREFIRMRDIEIVETREGEIHLEMVLPEEIRELDAFEWQKLATPIHLQAVGFTADGESKILGETRYYVGSPLRAAVMAIAALLLFYLLPLYFLKRRREKGLDIESVGVSRPGLKEPFWFSLLWLGRERHGRASLSNCQIALWTYLVFGVAAYVFVLNGQLIDISNSILILLGITGSASVAARFTATRQEERLDVMMRTTEAAGPGPGNKRLILAYPAWHDLVSTAGQVDLVRLQMFVFTVLAASYVGITAIVTFQFPEVPEGLLWLMGISNGVYLGGKFAEPRLADRLADIDLQRRTARRSRETKESQLKAISDRFAAQRAEEARLQEQVNNPPAGVRTSDLQAPLEERRQEIRRLEQQQAAAQQALEKASEEESRLESTYRDILKQLNKSIENIEVQGGPAAS